MERSISENTGENTSCWVDGGHTIWVVVLFISILTLITPCPLPSWAAVAGSSDVVTGGVVQTVTYLATAVAICPCRALWEGSESPVQPWESGARLSLTVWLLSVWRPLFGRLAPPKVPESWSAFLVWLTAFMVRLTGQVTQGWRMSPSSQLITRSVSMYPPPGCVGTEPVESQWN